MRVSEFRPRIKAYLGFAIKAGKAVFGADNILQSKKAKVILTDASLKDNSLKKILSHAETLNCVHISVDGLKNYTAKEGCKAVAVTDRELAKAIINCAEGADIQGE